MNKQIALILILCLIGFGTLGGCERVQKPSNDIANAPTAGVQKDGQDIQTAKESSQANWADPEK